MSMSWLWIIIASVSLQGFDLEAVRKEVNPEKRSALALANASAALDAARTASQAGDLAATQVALKEVDASIDVVSEALAVSGKDARRNPKYFKRAELAARQLLRRLEGMVEALSFDDRPIVERVRDHVASVHEELLTGIMGKKKQ